MKIITYPYEKEYHFYGKKIAKLTGYRCLNFFLRFAIKLSSQK
jgi:hypothetical protein